MLVLEKSYRKSFENHIHQLNDRTKYAYDKTLNNFESFYNNKAIEQLKEADNIYPLLQSWINDVADKISPSTTRSYFSRVKRYLNFCEIEISSEQVKAKLIFPKKVRERFYGVTLEDIRRILDNTDYKHKTMHLCQLSGGLRIGELVQLKKEDLKLKDGHFIVEIPSKIAKNHKARITFFSTEASKYLKPILNKIKDTDRIFGTNENSFHSTINEEQIFRRSLNRAGLTKRYDTGRYRINTHSLRAFFITKASRHDPNLAHFLSGQESKIYLAQYDRMSDDEMYEIYLEIEPDLIIDSTERQKIKIEKLEQSNTALEEKDKEIKSLKGNMEKIVDKKIDEFSKRFVKEMERFYEEQGLKLNKELDKMDSEFEKDLKDLKKNK